MSSAGFCLNGRVKSRGYTHRPLRYSRAKAPGMSFVKRRYSPVGANSLSGMCLQATDFGIMGLGSA